MATVMAFVSFPKLRLKKIRAAVPFHVPTQINAITYISNFLCWSGIVYLYMCILSMLQSTGGVSIDRFDGRPDRLANSCKHPPSQHRLLYLYLCLYKIQKDRLAIVANTVHPWSDYPIKEFLHFDWRCLDC